MKQITQSLSDLPYILVNFGVDTLVLDVRYADASGNPVRSELPEDARKNIGMKAGISGLIRI